MITLTKITRPLQYLQKQFKLMVEHNFIIFILSKYKFDIHNKNNLKHYLATKMLSVFYCNYDTSDHFSICLKVNFLIALKCLCFQHTAF